MRNLLIPFLVGISISAAAPSRVHAVTTEEIARQVAAIEKNAPDLARRQQLLEAYQKAGEFVAAQAAHEAAIEDFRKSASRGPNSRRELIEKAARLDRSKHTPPVSQRELTLDSVALEQLLEQSRAERATLEGKLSSYELRLRALDGRPAENSRQRTVVNSRIAELEAYSADVHDQTSDEKSRAHATSIEAELSARNAELELLNQEQLGHGLRQETLNLRREVALLELERLSARVTALERALIERRHIQTENAQASAKRAQIATNDSPPLAQKVARENQVFADELAKINAQQAQTAAQRAKYAERRLQINSEYELARQRLRIAVTSASLGQVLVEQRRRLPLVTTLDRQATSNALAVAQASLRRIEIEERLLDVETSQRDIKATISGAQPTKSTELEAQFGELLRAQKLVLESLDANYASLLRVLDAADAELTQLRATVSGYSELLDQRLLWIPNARVVSFTLLSETLRAIREIADVASWRNVAADLRTSAQANWFRTVLISGLLVALFRMRGRFERRLKESASRQQGAHAERIRDTAEVAALTTGLAAPWAILWLGLGSILQAGSNATELSFAIGQVLPIIALLAFVSRWVQVAVSPHGIAISQIGVDPARALQFGLAWRKLGRVFVPSYGVAVALDSFGGTAAQHALVRVLFMVAMVSLGAFGYWMLQRWLIRRGSPDTLGASRLRSAPSALLVLPVVGLFGLSAVGYHYTAIQLSKYYLITAGYLVGSIALYLMALRWLRIAAARLEAKYAADSNSEVVSKEEVARELASFNTQAKLILRNALGWSLAISLYLVWRDVLPALTIFDRISLWEIEIKDAAGVLHTQAITIANIALSSIIFAITVLAARNVPGVIEVGVLQRFQVHHGSRYAISSLLRYAIVAIGLSFALSTLGLRWSQIQWLVAALGVGLGFGLQEIFANFISGLILLFERPVRVGDFVTIGDMTGKVTRIQIRATTITNPDNKEIIVPNKTFITERFLNWTLSDQVTRVVISVGVAYGTNSDKAVRILLETAYAHPKVMREPAPQAVLIGFGDSALQFELQVFAEELNHRLDVRHELNTEIYRAFAAHGIEIPYPQRDLHIRGAVPATTALVAPNGA